MQRARHAWLHKRQKAYSNIDIPNLKPPHHARRTESAIGALIITYTILEVPYCNYSIMGPKTLFELLIKRPLYHRTLHRSLIDPFKEPTLL